MREMFARNSRKRWKQGTFGFSGKLENREEQGGTLCDNSDSRLPLRLKTFSFDTRRSELECGRSADSGSKSPATKSKLAGTAALTIISSAAFAQQALTGTVTQVNWINRTVAIKQTQSGTVGANTGGAASEEFKAQDGFSLDTLHAGNKVTFSVTETGRIKTITTLQNQ